MGLTRYRKKRDFRRTAEPRGSVKCSRRTDGMFVIQKHDASRLHYDFRLELDGVLKSWAVPKGPSLDPKQKRLAVEVEDHPVEYGSFEGVIPEGEYGGGTVLLWDRGKWHPEGDPHEGLRSGRLKFELDGEKLHGKWMLVRSSRQNGSKPQWLLFKLRDDEAQPESKYRIVDKLPLSVASERDLEEIAIAKDRVWGSNRSSSARTSKVKKQSAVRRRFGAGVKAKRWPRLRRTGPSLRSDPATPAVRGKSHARVPRSIDPQLPTLVETAPDGDQWLHEIKLDGYRMICHVDGDTVKFVTRNHLDWTAKLPELVEAVRERDLDQAVIDGEVVAMNEQGITDFQALQNAFRDRQRDQLIYTAFDLLFLDGADLRPLPLDDRKAKLAALKLPVDHGRFRYTEHLVGNGPDVLGRACKNGLEGIVSKRRDRPYVSGRTTDWLKSKCQEHAEFVIGGYTDPAGTRRGFGALLLGYHDRSKKLVYAGRVGTGFSEKTLADMLKQLKELKQSNSPFADFPPRGRSIAGAHWVRPRLVAQVRFSNWTRDNQLRHPAFQGLREDKPARLITREKAKSVMRVKKRAAKSRTSESTRRRSGDETEIAGVRVTHPDKVLYPDDGITKRDLAEYYLSVAQQMLPLAAGRPLALVRCPDGIQGERFFQKHPGHVAPPQLRRVKIREKEGDDQYLVIDEMEDLVALAQISAVEIHVWGARADNVEKPDQMVLDLDPAPDVAWADVVSAAIELRDFLGELDLQSFVKTSGGKGLHIVAPLQRTHSWDTVREFSELIARAVERAAPDRYTANMSKRVRTGKIYVDYLRNQRGATSVAAFSTRARPGAPISTPLSWQELRRIKSADQFQLRNIDKRLRSLKHDPWKGFDQVHQRLTAAMVKQLRTG